MLRQRIITAVIAGVALLAVLFAAPNDLARGVIAILLMIGAWEWSGFLGSAVVGRVVFVALVAALIGPALFGIVQVNNELVFQVALAWWLVAFVWTFFYPTRIIAPVAWLAGVLVIVPAWVALDWLYIQGVWTVLFMLGIVWSADIGAYFAGKAFGRVKLALRISPGKTWEGAIGGLVGVTLLISVASAYLDFPLMSVLPLALAVAVISIIGDLTVSMFKRNSGLKDSGSLFPGHGGFLDRADSVTAAAPLFALGLTWLGPQILGLAQ